MVAVSGAGRDQRTGLAPEDQRYDQLLADLQRLLRDPTTRGLTLKGVQLVAGSNVLAHRLGRAPEGWYPVRVTGANAFSARETASDARFLTLDVVAPCTVDLRVF